MSAEELSDAEIDALWRTEVGPALFASALDDIGRAACRMARRAVGGPLPDDRRAVTLFAGRLAQLAALIERSHAFAPDAIIDVKQQRA